MFGEISKKGKQTGGVVEGDNWGGLERRHEARRIVGEEEGAGVGDKTGAGSWENNKRGRMAAEGVG